MLEPIQIEIIRVEKRYFDELGDKAKLMDDVIAKLLYEKDITPAEMRAFIASRYEKIQDKYTSLLKRFY